VRIKPSFGRLEHEGAKRLENNEVEKGSRLFSWGVPGKPDARSNVRRSDNHASSVTQKPYLTRTPTANGCGSLTHNVSPIPDVSMRLGKSVPPLKLRPELGLRAESFDPVCEILAWIGKPG